MAEQLTIDIVTLASAVYSGPAEEVQLPGFRGELGILPGHLPLVTLVEPGVVVVKHESGDRYWAVSTGFAEIIDNRVTLLVRTCEGADAIDVERARKAAKEAEGHMVDINSPIVLKEEEAERLIRARARLAVVERAKGKS